MTTDLPARGLRQTAAVVVPFASLMLGWWAQTELDKGTNLGVAAAIFFVAAALFVLALRSLGVENEEEGMVSPRVGDIRIDLVVLSLSLGVGAFFASTGNQFRLIGVLFWLGSIVIFIVALPHSWDLSAVWARQCGLTLPRSLVVGREILALVAITVVGAFFRFYQLDLIPAEMGCDLPLKYDNVQQILSGNVPVFFPSHPGREALFFYWTAIFAKVFGLSHLVIKFSAALIGTLTIPTLYFIARRIYSAEAGLYAALLLSLSHFHIIQSRIGYRAILVPLFAFVLLYLTVRVVHNQHETDFALAGLWIGLGLYTYNSWLIAPFAFALGVIAYWITARNMSFLALVRGIVIAGLAAILVWVPLARYANEHSEMYLLRVMTRISETETAIPPDLPGVFIDNLRRTFLMLNYRGDSVFVMNVPFMRELGFIPAILFVLGLGYALKRWRYGYNSLVVILFVIMLLPSALSLAFPAEVPNANRSSGGVAMAILVAALTLPLIRKQLAERAPELRLVLPLKRFAISGAELSLRANFNFGTGWIVPLLTLLLVLTEARDSYVTYFVRYVAALPDHNYAISLNLARALDDYVGNGSVFIKYWSSWYDGNALRVQLQKMPKDGYRELLQFDLNAPPFTNFQGRAMILLNPLDKEALALLRQSFPGGVLVEHRDPVGELRFISFYVQR